MSQEFNGYGSLIARPFFSGKYKAKRDWRPLPPELLAGSGATGCVHSIQIRHSGNRKTTDILMYGWKLEQNVFNYFFLE